MRLQGWLFVCGSLGGALTAWACGSSEDNGDIIAAQADSGASSTSSGGSSGATSSSGGSSSGGSSSGSSGATDGGSSSGALGGDGGLNPPDAGPGGDTTKITCGATNCALSTDVCCVSEVNGGLSYACATASTGCPANAGGDVAALKCSGQANCAPPNVCCVSQTSAGAASECKASCGGNEAQLCDKNAADAGCPTGVMCSSKDIGDWALPQGYATCGGVGN